MYGSHFAAAVLGDNPTPLSTWFMVTFFLIVVKVLASSLTNPAEKKHHLNILTTRVNTCIDMLTVPPTIKKKGWEHGFEENTDFRVKQPYQDFS